MAGTYTINFRSDLQQAINSGPGRTVDKVAADLQVCDHKWAEQCPPADELRVLPPGGGGPAGDRRLHRQRLSTADR